MGKYVSDLMMGGFVIVLLILFLRKPQESVSLVSGGLGAYTKTVSDLATIPIGS